jgi:hypothetical protein
MKKSKQIALVKVNSGAMTENDREIFSNYIKEQLEDYAVLVIFDTRLDELIKVELIK